MNGVNLQDRLIFRGIASAAQDAGWSEHSFSGQKGWRYPLFNARGQRYAVEGKTAYRWKNADSKGNPKYAWLPTKPDGIRYYLLPDTLAAIKQAGGRVYIASGEPDVLAYRSAGIHNVICWFGELTPPDTLAADLQAMGVWMAIYCPDRDNTGMKSAAKVDHLLDGSEVAFDCRALPGEIGSKYDINQLWMDVQADPARFALELAQLPMIDSIDLQLFGMEDAPDEDHDPRPLPPAADKELPARFVEAILRDVESQPGWKKWKANGWSNNFRCPLHAGDDRASAGFNRVSMSFNCFTCGDKNSKDYGAERGIHLRDFFDDPLPRVNDGASRPLSSNGTTSGNATVNAAPDDEPLYLDNRQVAEIILKELKNEEPPSVEPMEFPFTSLHRFGGFAELMWPGKMVYISGVSGGGKTSFGENCYRKAVMLGEGGVWYGPEWSPVEMGLRELQRAGGLSMNTYAKMRVWRVDENKKMPEQHRRGALPPLEQRQKSIDKMLDMLNWPGIMCYMQPSERLNTLKAVLDTMEEAIVTKREAGHKMSMLFFDYLQRAPKSGGARGWDWAETVVGEIKALCERQRLFGFVFVQPKKTDSRGTRDGEALNESSGQGVSDQQSNLYLAMTPGFDRTTGKKAPYVRLDIVKNSMGQSPETVYLKTAMDRLTILDEEVKDPNAILASLDFRHEDEQ